jgi:hypothetical protein
MHIAATILERSLVLDSESLKSVEELTGERYPEWSAPRVAQRQIKLAFFMTQSSRIRDVLRGWGRLMWKSSPSKNLSQDWATAICVFLTVVLVMDKIIGSAYYFCGANIQYGRGDPVKEREEFTKLVKVLQTELFDRCKEIFHWRYRSRKWGKDSFNPIRDGILAWREQVPSPEVVEFTWDLRRIVAEFRKPSRHDINSIF